jgi:hypothetical protein
MTRTTRTYTRFQRRAIACLVVTAALLCFSGDAAGGGLSLERFTAAIAEYQSQLTEEQIAFGWERFLAFYNN